jgi:hypothetical protein
MRLEVDPPVSKDDKSVFAEYISRIRRMAACGSIGRAGGPMHDARPASIEEKVIENLASAQSHQQIYATVHIILC